MNYLKHTILLIVFILLAGVQVASACEVEFQVTKGQKEIYEADDVIIVQATVKLTHRNCQVEIDATKFECAGAEIAGATKWKKVGTNEYERKLKLQVLADETKKIELTGTRTCRRRGGAAEKMTLPKKAATTK